MKIYFDHEKLDVYRKALAFAQWAEVILERIPKSAAVHNQLDRARTSIVLNIPEGNGRFTPAIAANSSTSRVARGWNLPVVSTLSLSRNYSRWRNWMKVKPCLGTLSLCWSD